MRSDRDTSSVGSGWISNFIKRQPQLRTHYFRRYDYQGAKCEDPGAINAWFSLVANTIAKYGIRLDDNHNFDKTGFMMGVIASGMVVTAQNGVGTLKKCSLENVNRLRSFNQSPQAAGRRRHI